MNTIPKHALSKSTFMYGCQCERRLWLHKFMPEVRDEEDETTTSIFRQGTDVGILARELFPGGVDATPIDSFSYQDSVAETAAYIQAGHKIIYEAAFQFEGVLCAVDILVKKRNKWFAYEVKSTTKVKDPHIQDAALQYYVLTKSGLDLQDISVVHLNNGYIRQGALEPGKLFTCSSVLISVSKLQLSVAKKIVALKKVLTQKTQPKIEPGPHCNKPYACDFNGYCTKDLEPEIIDYGRPRIDKDSIKDFTNGLQYPLFFMDFEAWMAAVPAQDGHWSYRQVNFQFSVHIQRQPGDTLEHHHYLAESTSTPQRHFIEALLEVLGKKGSILVYNKTFENSRLTELSRDYPCYASAIGFVQGRLVDLMTPFRKRHYYLPEMEGSYSIKNVLPALVPGFDYANLSIADGAAASHAFYNLDSEKDETKKTEVRKALLEYCGQDTMAMVKILEVLRKVK